MLLRLSLAVAAVAVSSALSGCATVESTTRGTGPHSAPLKQAGFRLQAHRVVWQQNPSLPLRYLAPQNTSEAQQQKTRQELATFFTSLQSMVAKDIETALLARLRPEAGVGGDHLLLLTPVQAERFTAPFGAGLTVRTQVLAKDGRVLWQDDLRLRAGAGNLLMERLNAPEPDAADRLAQGLVQAFRSVNLIGG